MKCFATILILAVFSTPAYAVTWFAGTGNDGYINDVNGIFSALSNSPGLQNISINSFIFENQTGSGIQNSINHFSSLVQKGDILFWYYSGHGSFTEDIDQDETAINSTALDNYDETLGLLNHPDQITDDNLANAFNNLSLTGAKIITLFDTCYAGGFIGGGNDLNKLPDLIFFGSSMESEASYSFTGEPYSIFTQGLILGLEDFSADLNNDGIIIAQEWFDFSYDYTTGIVSNQHPLFAGIGDFIIASNQTVPIPEAIWMLGSGLLGIAGARRKFV